MEIETDLPCCAMCSRQFSMIGYRPDKCFNVPFVLHCGHSVCDKCLMGGLTKQDELLCMVCRKLSIVPENLTDYQKRLHFPINYHLCGLWFHRSDPVPFDGDSHLSVAQEKKQERIKLKLVNCNECSLSATLHCNQCSVPYCLMCFNTVHATVKALKGHIKIPIWLTTSSKSIKLSNVCPEHQQNYEFHCGQCDVPTCSRCLRFSHNGHTDTLLLSEKNGQCREELVEHYIQVTNVQSRLKAANEVAKRLKTIDDLSDPVNFAIQEIEDHFISLHSHLVLLQNKFVLQLKQASIPNTLKELSTVIKKNLLEIKDVLSMSSSALQNQSSSADFTQYIKLFKEKIDTPCFFNGISNTEKKMFMYDEGIYKMLDEHCKIALDATPICTLLTENELPEDYQKEPISETTVYDFDQLLNNSMKETSYNSISLSQTSLNSSTSSFDLSHMVPPDDLIPGVTIKATVSHLVSPSEFYIHRTGTQKKIDDLQQHLKKTVKRTFSKTSFTMHVGSIYAVLYKDNVCWLRGRIIQVNSSDEAFVDFIDYGFKETVKKIRLRELPSNTINLPGLALRCKLANCVPRSSDDWDLEAVALMVKAINNNPVDITIVSSTQLYYEVTMFILNGTVSSNIVDSLCFLGYSSFAKMKSTPGPSISTSTVRYFPNITYSNGEILEVKITHINSPHDFYVIVHSDHLRKYVSMLERLDKMYNNKNAANKNLVYHPLEGLPVAAKSDEDHKWHRAYIMDAPSPKLIKVFFVDWGSVETINWKNVRHLDENFITLRPQVHKCRLVDVDPVDATWTKEANSLLDFDAESRLKIYVKNTSDTTLNVILYETNIDADICINALLVRENYATSTGTSSTLVEFPKVYEMPAPDILQAVQCDFKSEKELKEMPYLVPNLLDEKLYSAGKDGCMRILIDIKKIVSPGEFYITLPYLDEAYKEMDEELQYSCSTLPESSNIVQWYPNNKCAVLLGNKWWRGYVLEVKNDEEIHVYFPDFAEKHTVPSSTLRPLPQYFAEIRDRILRCHLGGLLPAQNTWSGISITEFHEYVDDKQGSLYMTKMNEMTEEQSLPIELYAKIQLPVDALEPRKDTWISFNQYIRVRGYAKSDGITKWSSDGSIIKTDAQILASIKMQADIHAQLKSMQLSKPQKPTKLIDYPKWLPSEKFTHLEFVGLPTYVTEEGIYIQDFMQNTGRLEHINKEIFKKYNQVTPTSADLNWNPGQMCSALYYLDRKWYRGLVVAVEDQRVLINFIDFGNTEYASINLVREPMFTDVPIQTTLCKFNRLKPINGKWEETQINAIQEILVDKFCRTKVIVLPDGSYGIDQLNLPNGKCALAEIVNKRLAKFFETIEEEEEEEDEFLTPPDDKELAGSFDFTKLGTLRLKYQVKSIEIPHHIKSFIADYSAVLTPTFISLSLSNYLQETAEFFEEFNQLIGTMKNEASELIKLEAPYLYKPCCVLFEGDNNWYRGFVIKELPNNIVHVQYTDYGNIEVVNVNNVFQVKSHWLDVASPSILVELDDLVYNTDSDISSENLRNELFAALAGPTSEIVIKSRSGPYMSVDIVESETKKLVYQELIDKKYYIRKNSNS